MLRPRRGTNRSQRQDTGSANSRQEFSGYMPSRTINGIVKIPMAHSLFIASRNIQLKTIAVSLVAAAVLVCVGSAAHRPDDLSHRNDRVGKRAGIVVGASLVTPLSIDPVRGRAQ